MSNLPYEELTLEYMLRACIRNFPKFLISLLATIVLMGGFISYKLWIKPAYISNSVLLISPKTSLPAADTIADGQLDTLTLGTLKEASSAYINLVNNRWVIYRALNELGIVLDDVEEFMEENVEITAINSSPYLNVSIKFSDADYAYQVNQKIIDLLPDMLKDFKIAANVTVISYPISPTMPDLPSTLLLVAIGGGFCLLLGFILVLFGELGEGVIRNRKDIERVLNTPCIGLLPAKRNKGRETPPAKKYLNRIAAYLNLSGARVVALVCVEQCNVIKNVIYHLASFISECGFSLIFLDFLFMKESSAFANSLKPNSKIKYVNLAEEGTILPGDVHNAIKKLREEHSLILCYVPPASVMPFAAECFGVADLNILMVRHGMKQADAKKTLTLVKQASDRCACIVYDIPEKAPFSYMEEY